MQCCWFSGLFLNNLTFCDKKGLSDNIKRRRSPLSRRRFAILKMSILSDFLKTVLAEGMGRRFCSAKSAVLRPPQACSDQKAPPEPSALSGFESHALAQQKKKEHIVLLFLLAEGMGLEPTRPFSPTRFPGELLSHSVNPPCRSRMFFI